MYSQVAYHVSIARIDELNRHADHRSRAAGGDRRRVRWIRRLAAGRRSGSGLAKGQPRQLLDPRV
jgi:hypothetical protein